MTACLARDFLYEGQYGVHIVRISHAIAALESAELAFLSHHIALSCRAFYGDWRHHATAFRRPVARIDIHMFAPEALRAVIGVPCSCHRRPAVFAGEVFCSFLKRHHWILTVALDSATPPESLLQVSVYIIVPDPVAVSRREP